MNPYLPLKPLAADAQRLFLRWASILENDCLAAVTRDLIACAASCTTDRDPPRSLAVLALAVAQFAAQIEYTLDQIDDEPSAIRRVAVAATYVTNTALAFIVLNLRSTPYPHTDALVTHIINTSPSDVFPDLLTITKGSPA